MIVFKIFILFKPKNTRATQLGCPSVVYMFLYQIFAIRIMSANTPAAVTLAPAPYPWISIGYSL